MRAIIKCAGNGDRWNNYTGVRKHLLEIEGESLVRRMIRQLIARRITDIRIVCHPEAVYDQFQGPSVSIHTSTTMTKSNAVSRLATRYLWSKHDNTIILLGDVWFSDAAMDIICARRSEWTHYARLSESKATGKPGPEMFAVQMPPDTHNAYAAALEAAGDGTDWPVYCAFVGRPIDTKPEDIRDWGHHVDIPDDGTDDFDFADDYERWLTYTRNLSSRRVTRDQFDEPWFKAIRDQMRRTPIIHRKTWELASIARAWLDRFPPRPKPYIGLGFGCGKEPLPAWFVSRGASVIATDGLSQGVWLDRQYSDHKDALPHEGICGDEEWRNNCIYERLDMNNIPTRFNGCMDFTWSCSSMEHLGGIHKALAFFTKQMQCLRKGGIAFHVTEVAAYEEPSINTENLCILRPSDLGVLRQGLAAQGDMLWPVNLAPGTHPEDRIVLTEPYPLEPHLNLSIGPVQFTSVLLIAARGYGHA